MKQYNCKNCGAPIKHTYNHRCEYCNSILDFNVEENKIVRVKPTELTDLELIEAEIEPYSNSMRFIFKGYKRFKPTFYEINEDDYISSIEEYINPTKCGYMIEIPMWDIARYGIDYVLYRIESNGIYLDDKNREKLKYQISKEIKV